MKCTITIEDLEGDKVKITMDPTAETLMKMVTSGETMSSAAGYALGLANKAREISKAAVEDKKQKIILPKFGPGMF